MELEICFSGRFQDGRSSRVVCWALLGGGQKYLGHRACDIHCGILGRVLI